MPKNPSKEIKTLRQELNLSQKRFGEKIGISGKTVSAYETGRIIPPHKVMEKIASVYNFELSETCLMTTKIALQTVREIKEKLSDIEASLM